MNRGRKYSEIYTKEILEQVLGIETILREKPDLEYESNGHKIGIEITEACNKDFKAAENCIDDKEKVDRVNTFNETNIKQNNNMKASLVVDNNIMICGDPKYAIYLIQQAINAKSEKNYRGYDELWLAVYCSFEVNYLYTCEEELKKLDIKDFKGVYVISTTDKILYRIRNIDKYRIRNIDKYEIK